MAKANINNLDGFSSTNEELSVDNVVHAVVVSNSELEILQRYAAVKEQLNAERQREGKTT